MCISNDSFKEPVAVRTHIRTYTTKIVQEMRINSAKLFVSNEHEDICQLSLVLELKLLYLFGVKLPDGH